MGPHTHPGSRRALAFVLALNALTCLVEFAAGWWTNSLALLSDADLDEHEEEIRQAVLDCPVSVIRVDEEE